ncbi:immunity repressor [Gordonia phage Budski]|nr:immunity repressor [Gordonia phage Budski]
MSDKHALGELIDQVKKANNWSDQTVSDRAAARHHEISRSNVARVRTEPLTTIGSKQLFALSAGLGIPVRQLAQAAMASMGIEGFSTTSADAEHAIAEDPTIPEHVRQTLLTIIRNERSSRRGASDALPTRTSTPPRAPRKATKGKKTTAGGKVTPLRRADQVPKPERPEDAKAARKRNPRFKPEDPDESH